MPSSRRVMSAARFLAAAGQASLVKGASVGTGNSSAPAAALRGAGRFTIRKNGRYWFPGSGSLIRTKLIMALMRISGW